MTAEISHDQATFERTRQEERGAITGKTRHVTTSALTLFLCVEPCLVRPTST